MNHLRTLKNAELRRKHSTYTRLAKAYNEQFSPANMLSTPTLEEVEGMVITDAFFDCGALSHPQEPWAVHAPTQDGIDAYLISQRCEEELLRISKEVRQMLIWALEHQSKLDALRADTIQGMIWLYRVKFFADRGWTYCRRKPSHLGHISRGCVVFV